MTYRTYDSRLDDICVHAWEAWTQNGRGLDDRDREITAAVVRHVVAQVYVDGIDDLAWLQEVAADLEALSLADAIRGAYAL